jgi:hypothetical protein
MFTFLPGPFLVQFSGPFYLSTDSELPPSKLIINEIIKAEARASLIDAMVFTREAAAILMKGSEKFMNKLIEQQK